jgi:hypothetical protein
VENNNRSFLKKHSTFIFIFIIGVIFLIPLCIILPQCIISLFKIFAPFECITSELEISDVIAFYSVLLGAGIAVSGVFLSIQYTQENYRDDVRNRVLPFFSIEVLSVKARVSLTSNSQSSAVSPKDEKTNYYEEFSENEFYFTIKGGSVSVKSDWTDEQKSIIYNARIQIVKLDSYSWGAGPADYMNVPIKVTNIGLGSAIHFQIGLNVKGKNDCLTKMLTVIPMQDIMLHIYIDGLKICEYELIFRYCDIYENHYKQVFPLEVKKIGTDGETQMGIELDYSGLQKQIIEDVHNG